MIDVLLNEDMEMPCLCKCGRWFDLNDGFGSVHSNIVICEMCHEDEIQEQYNYEEDRK